MMRFLVWGILILSACSVSIFCDASTQSFNEKDTPQHPLPPPSSPTPSRTTTETPPPLHADFQRTANESCPNRFPPLNDNAPKPDPNFACPSEDLPNETCPPAPDCPKQTCPLPPACPVQTFPPSSIQINQTNLDEMISNMNHVLKCLNDAKEDCPQMKLWNYVTDPNNMSYLGVYFFCWVIYFSVFYALAYLVQTVEHVVYITIVVLVSLSWPHEHRKLLKMASEDDWMCSPIVSFVGTLANILTAPTVFVYPVIYYTFLFILFVEVYGPRIVTFYKWITQ